MIVSWLKMWVVSWGVSVMLLVFNVYMVRNATLKDVVERCSDCLGRCWMTAFPGCVFCWHIRTVLSGTWQPDVWEHWHACHLCQWWHMLWIEYCHFLEQWTQTYGDRVLLRRWLQSRRNCSSALCHILCCSWCHCWVSKSFCLWRGGSVTEWDAETSYVLSTYLCERGEIFSIQF